MGKYIALLGLIPQILRLVSSIEELIPTARQGARKLALLQEFLSDTWESVDEKPGVTMGEVLRFAERITARAIAFFNQIGIFKTTKEVKE